MTKKDSPQHPIISSSQDSAQSEMQTLEGSVQVTSDSFKITKEVFGHYEIIGELGSGGMGIVYKAYDPALKRFAALKLIRKDNPDLAVRFVQEARAQARVQHENVCRVYEVGEAEGKQYIAMQLIEGKSLSAASKEMPTEVKVQVIKQVAEALHAAHKQGLIHRDVKPTNIMLERTEENQLKPYVLDFGLARDQDAPGLTRTGVAVGTPYYMAPEQVSGERDQIDRRTDVYGLGATLYEVLSGRPPYEGKSGTEILLQILKDDPVPLRKVAPKVPQDLETIVMKCLERDPSRRYESSKALADDLQRFLDGEPLAATPVSLSYRLIKKARKNPLAAGIAIAAAMITIVLVTSFFWVQWQNKLQAQYAREFGDEVKNIQSVLPNIYTAPIHDVRSEIAALRSRLEKMEERVKQGGRAAQDPGNNALGQGYLALGEIEKARIHLEKAWNSGYQLPSTAYALGQTMGLLFQKKLDESERNTSEEVRNKLKKQYEKEFKDPAVKYLRKAEHNVESPAYVVGLIALYEKRYDEALKKSREAYEKSRWSYEAKTLEGKALVGIAQKKSDVGDYKGAIQQYQLAGEAYATASALGRSRADIYLSDCDRWGKTIVAQTYTDIGPDVSLKKAEEACNKAILIDPDDGASYLRKSFVYNRLARYQLYSSSDDPRVLTKKAIDSANEAQRKDPDSWEPHHALLLSNEIAGEYELRHGINPQSTIQEAIKHAEKGLKLQQNPSLFYVLGVTYALLGEYEEQNGKNPIPTFEKAIQQYRRVEEIGSTINIGMEKGIAYSFIADYQKNHGQDPSSNFNNAIKVYEESLNEAPDDPYVLYNLGTVYNDRGTYEMALGKDPTTSYQRALEAQKKASKFIPNNSYILNGIGFIYCNIAQFLISQKKNPGNEINEARKYLLQASEVDANYYMPYTNLGFVEGLNAEWAIQQKQSPVPYLDAARKAYQKSVERNKEEPTTYASIADVYRSEADWQIQQKSSAEASISQGMQWIEKSLNLNKENPYANAVQGALLLLQARTENNATKRREYASSATTFLEKALKKDPLLRKQYEPILKEAKAFQN